MKNWFAALILFLIAIPLRAERTGDQGVGVMVGAPSGLTWKMWMDENVALDAVVGVDQGRLDAHASFLWHNFNLAHAWAKKDRLFENIVSDGELPFYFGFGPRLLFKHTTEYGIRFPLGFAYMMNQSKWELFFEVAPILRLSPSTGLNGDMSIGARYYFPALRPLKMQ